MLSEEALILLAALGACGLLVLGVIDLMRPARRGRQHAPVHNRAAGHPRHARPGSPAPDEAPPPPVRRRRPEAEVAPGAGVAESTPAPASGAPAPAPVLPIIPEGLEPASVVEACFALYQEQRYDEVVSRGMAALTQAGAPDDGAHAQEIAALWSVIALARQAQGDDIAARGALEAAIAAAPEADRATYRHQLSALALHVAHGLMASAAGDSEARLDALRAAVAWVDAGLAATPVDASLRELRPSVLDALWPAYERVVFALVQRQDFRAARRLLREAMEHGEFPTARADTFHELLSGTFSGEIGQLTAHAIRSMQDARESEALAALERADELLGRLADEALPPKRREEVDRRLWWGYNKLGARRVEAGEFEEALEPLFHALRFPTVGPERQAETRATLVRALIGATDARALAIEELADAGDLTAAAEQRDELVRLLRTASAHGITEQQLSTAVARVERLSDALGRRSRR
jgi:tetratricopeptide (TPR) repeat protein